jgi:CRP/FNR family cyclic AMP-dependent transcriptional regulator
MLVATSVDPYQILSNVPLFMDLSEEELRALAHRTVSHHVPAGELIFSEGDPCQGFYVVESGEVRIFKTAASGREQVLTIERPGDTVAELPVFDGGAYPASALAITDTVLLFVSKRDFRTLILDHPEVGLKVLKIVGGRLRRLVGLIEELSFTTVRRRLIVQVVRLAKTEGIPTPRGFEVTLPSNQELASTIGTVRELVSRNLSRLQVEGLIRLDGKRVVIPDLDALAAAGEEGV